MGYQLYEAPPLELMAVRALIQGDFHQGGAVVRETAACVNCFWPVFCLRFGCAGLADGPRLLAGAACGGDFADSLSGVAAVCSLPERRGLGAQLGKKEDRLPLTDGRIIVFVKIILRGT